MVSSSRDSKWGSLVLVPPQTGQGSRITHILNNGMPVVAIRIAPEDIAKGGEERREAFRQVVVTDAKKAEQGQVFHRASSSLPNSSSTGTSK